MSAAAPPSESIADLLQQLGNVPPWRVRLWPQPGTAKEQDLLEIHARTKRLFELVDGVLVEKALGFRESLLACALVELIRQFVRPRRLGIVVGEAGMIRLLTGRVRIPDVAFVSWASLPGGRIPDVPIPDLAPDLAIEVLSESNMSEELARKRQDYFTTGTRLVWQIDPRTRTAEVFTAPEKSTELGESQALDGGDVLPGLTLPLRELFGELDEQAPPA